ncbi:MAG: hypothetical protein ACRDRJ_34390 [Streptosporangiaceae bacterium]
MAVVREHEVGQPGAKGCATHDVQLGGVGLGLAEFGRLGIAQLDLRQVTG